MGLEQQPWLKGSIRSSISQSYLGVVLEEV